MKKFMTILLVVAMMFSLAACGGSGDSDSSDSSKEEQSSDAEGRRIGVIIGDSTQDYYNLGLAGIKSKVNENDELIVYDCKQDIDKQYDLISDLINQQVDVIVIAVINSDAMISGLKLIKESGIPCFCYDQELTEEGAALAEAQLYISDYTIGLLGGQAMAEGLKEKTGEYKGKVMTYAASHYNAGALRLEGFKDALEEYPDIDVFFNSDEDWNSDTATGVVESTLLANPDMNGFWGWSELPTIGAVKAFEENDCLEDMVITTNECSATMYDYIENGKIYSGTELNGYGVGQEIMNMVYAFLEGEKVESKEADIFNIKKDNLDKATTPFALEK